MPQQAIAAILLRQLTSYLARAIFWVDLAGNLLFYDEPAGALLAYRYEEAGEMLRPLSQGKMEES
jgi:hypothetical protein